MESGESGGLGPSVSVENAPIQLYKTKLRENN